MASSQHHQPSSQGPKDVPPYELLYWPDGMGLVTSQISANNLGDALNPPPLAPPILQHGPLLINQTPNILLYLGPRLGLVPSVEEDASGVYRVNELALTALDGLSNEVHDCHHPVSTALYYEDQKAEAKRKSQDYLQNRLPKFLAYFERVLNGEASKGGTWLYGGVLTYADLVLFQCLDGLRFAFPNALTRLAKGAEYAKVFALYENVKSRPNIKQYLASGRRQQYGMGIYRHYPELDEQ
ncbi:hypothetical protein LZ554_003996 [Drepanopeziza brunnea f. sp. 'monogermtubi']|nr:hypothetical protein LZ554_003996 [Drepanopeziza brunnea f. sp. 'monogermtubi']